MSILLWFLTPIFFMADVIIAGFIHQIIIQSLLCLFFIELIMTEQRVLPGITGFLLVVFFIIQSPYWWLEAFLFLGSIVFAKWFKKILTSPFLALSLLIIGFISMQNLFLSFLVPTKFHLFSTIIEIFVNIVIGNLLTSLIQRRRSNRFEAQFPRN